MFMGGKLKNVTFSLPEELIDGYRKLAQQHQVASMNAAVREALEVYIAKKEQQQLFQEMEKAARDPLFVEDLREAMQDFAAVDQDILDEKAW